MDEKIDSLALKEIAGITWSLMRARKIFNRIEEHVIHFVGVTKWI